MLIDLENARLAVQSAKIAYEKQFKIEMVRVAKEHGITIMRFGLVTSSWYDAEDETECEELVKLERLFCQEIRSSGLTGIWTAEDGWI